MITEKITNGNMESMTGWVFGSAQSSQSTTQAHSATHSIFSYSDGTGFYQVINSIPVSLVTSLTFYSYGGQTSAQQVLRVTYTDNTHTDFQYGNNASSWSLNNALSSLSAGKVIKELRFLSGTAQPVYIDDLSMLSIDPPTITTRTKSVTILGQSLNGVIDSDWEDTNPWVRIEIPKGPILEQNLIGPHIDGEVSTTDWKSLYLCLFQIPISTGHYPINSDGSKLNFSATGTDFVIVLEDNLGNSLTYQFTNVKIKTIQLDKLPTSGAKWGVWKIKFMCDLCTYVP